MSWLAKTFVFLFTVVIVAGCGTKPIRDVITETKYKPLSVTKELLKSCHKTTPPDQVKYSSLGDLDRESELVDYSTKLLADIDKCNKQIKEIAAEQKKLLEDFK